MTALLTDNLPLLAGAPNGIKKLRELILELAVRGKLVPQDSSDEPASELLKRIAKEKMQLEVVGQIRKQKPLPQITEDELPFELPVGWAWARLADIAFSQAGFAFKSNGFNQAGLGLPLIRIRDVGQAFSGTYYEGDYRPEFLVQRGDYLISMDGEFRVAAWEGEASLLNQRVSRLIFFGEEIARRFIADSLQARLLELQGVKAYTTVDHLSGGQISESIIALPPRAEQHRIVAKVDELMALCDRLEAQQADAESAHARLVQALLDSLTQATDADDFAASWRRLSEHFHTLFTTESSIDALKQALLQLAVMGKLVPQDPNDEPASELLKRIAEEKAQLAGRKKNLTPISEVERPFNLPPGWKWARLGELGLTATGKTPSTGNPEFFGGEIPFVGPGQISVEGVISDPEKWLTQSGLKNSSLAEPKDILMVCIGGSIGKAAVADRVMAFNQQINSIRVLLAEHQYVYAALSEPRFQRSILNASSGSATPIINRSKWEGLLVSVPPLAEQNRIVTKAFQLFGLCDQLKARLTQARQLNEQLASVLVEQAVA